MSVEPYSNTEEQDKQSKVSEPAMQEMISKRKYALSKAMENSITLDDLDHHLTELIHRHYHPEA